MSDSHQSPSGSDARERMLRRVRSANEGREPAPHPGDFDGWRASDSPPVEGRMVRFTAMFEATGAEVVAVPGAAAAREWLGAFVESCRATSLAIGRGVPEQVVPDLPRADASEADLAVSSARGAIAETGSVILDARDGRRTQLLAPTHVVLLYESDVHGSARDAFRSMAGDLPAALGLHSGPSKSADIGQVMVKGVHGPGRLVALVIGSADG